MLEAKESLRTKIAASLLILFAVLVVGSIFFSVNLYAQHPETPVAAASPDQGGNVKAYGFIAAALAFGLGTVGAGIAIGNVGSAAMGAVAEKPEIAGQALIFVALAEGLVVFSFITALMILGKL
jgi:V/A-type H+-transporting ATPase subunit K